MKFLLDMGLGRTTALFLRTAGHDAVHLRDEGLQRLSDQDIVTKAIQEGRGVLTHDLDFGRIVVLSGDHFPSVITFRLDDMRSQQVNRYLQDVIGRFARDLENGALISVTERSVRIRRLPV